MYFCLSVIAHIQDFYIEATFETFWEYSSLDGLARKWMRNRADWSEGLRPMLCNSHQERFGIDAFEVPRRPYWVLNIKWIVPDGYIRILTVAHSHDCLQNARLTTNLQSIDSSITLYWSFAATLEIYTRLQSTNIAARSVCWQGKYFSLVCLVATTDIPICSLWQVFLVEYFWLKSRSVRLNIFQYTLPLFSQQMTKESKKSKVFLDICKNICKA